MKAHLLLLIFFFVCYFCSFSGGELIGRHQRSNKSLLSAGRLVARDRRKTWEIKDKFSFWVAHSGLSWDPSAEIYYKQALTDTETQFKAACTENHET